MYAERPGPQQHHSSPNMSQQPPVTQSPGGPGHHRTSSGPGSQYGAPVANGYGNGNGVPPPQPPTSQYNGASQYQQQPQQVQIPIQRQESNYAPPQPPPAPVGPPAPPIALGGRQHQPYGGVASASGGSDSDSAPTPTTPLFNQDLKWSVSDGGSGWQWPDTTGHDAGQEVNGGGAQKVYQQPHQHQGNGGNSETYNQRQEADTER